MTKDEAAALEWFKYYVNQIERKPEEDYKAIDDFYYCPCCHFPTLTERQGYDICSICDWEDDGQDDHNADEVLGGPNSDYSLTEARENFKLYLTQYRPTDIRSFEFSTSKKMIADKEVCFDITSIKKQMIEKYNELILFENKSERKIIFDEINELEKQLH